MDYYEDTEKIKKLFLSNQVPQGTKGIYWSIKGFQHAYITYKFLRDKQKILIVGDAGGRDYWFLKLMGKEVVCVDIAKQSMIPEEDLILADVTEHIPFEEKSFDAVVANEVLEHLLKDYEALKEFRRILKNNGILVCSVPFYADVDPQGHHPRIHSPTSIERLLKGCGFSVCETIYRGALLNFDGLIFGVSKIWVNFLNVFLPQGKLAIYCVHFSRCIKKLLFLVRLNYIIGKKCRFLVLKKLSLGYHTYGCHIIALKGEFKDYTEVNIMSFTK